MRENPLGGTGNAPTEVQTRANRDDAAARLKLASRTKKPPDKPAKKRRITAQTFYRWRKEYGGLKMDRAKRLKELEKENSKLKRPDGHSQQPQ
jgi:hypothetical protein